MLKNRAEKSNWNRMWHFPWFVTDGPHTTCLKIPTLAPIFIIIYDDASGHLEYMVLSKYSI